MKKTLIGIAAAFAVLVGTPALAANMPVKAAPRPIVSTEYDWSGVYVGVGVGWVRSSFDWRYTNPAPPTCCAPFSASADDTIIGFQGGAQYQFSHIVVGVEGSFSDFVDNRWARGPGCVIPNSFTIACQVRSQQIATFGGRLGFAWTDWMVYGEGGWANANVQSQLNSNSTGTGSDQTYASYRGTFYGAGIEHVIAVFSPAVSVIGGIEYQHINLGTQVHLAPLDLFGPCPPGVNCRAIGAKEDIFRFRVSVKFNPAAYTAAPVAAKN
jgi:outer membrane immunogenic protein